MSTSPELTTEDTALPLYPDETQAMEALSPEGRNSLENLQASIRQEQAELLAAGETAYERAVQFEGMYGLGDKVVDEYRKASQDLIAATAFDSMVEAGEPDQPMSPVTYLQIADSLTKRAIAPATAAYDDPLASTEVSRVIDQREYLGPKAIRYFDKGVELLLEADPETIPEGFEIPDNPSEVVASALMKAVKTADNIPERQVLADTSEHELAVELEANGTEEVEELLERVPTKKARLEIVSLASKELTEELSGDDHPLSLAA